MDLIALRTEVLLVRIWSNNLSNKSNIITETTVAQVDLHEFAGMSTNTSQRIRFYFLVFLFSAF